MENGWSFHHCHFRIYLKAKDLYLVKPGPMTKIIEKRAHRRLDLKLPLEFQHVGESRHNQWRTSTINVSTSGVYFETSLENIKVGDQLALAFGVEPNDPRFPPHGTINTVADVVRVETLPDDEQTKNPELQRFGIGARFTQPLKLSI